jgi:hypothetical protein
MDLGKLRIAVPTLARVERQIFVRNMPREFHKYVHFYAPDSECADLERVWKGTTAHPTKQEGHMGVKRQMMLDDAKGIVLMADDDVRITGTTWDKTKSQAKADGYLGANNVELWYKFFSLMKDCVRGGMGMCGVTYASQVWQTSRRAWMKQATGPSRLWGIYAINARMAKQFNFRFDNLRCMEDFDFNLQMLRSGVPTGILTTYVWNQPGSNVAGGCSTYRTQSVQAEAARGLESRHPNFVTIVEKESNWEGDMQEKRIDCRIAWAKAAEAGGCPTVEGLAPAREKK